MAYQPNLFIKRIDQFLPHYAKYDAIGTHVAYMQKLIRAYGFESDVFTEFTRNDTCDISSHLSKYTPQHTDLNINIYHHSTGCSLPQYLLQVPGYNIVDYHNITPPEYFDEIGDYGAARSCRDGLLQLTSLKLAMRAGWTDSHYNQWDLMDVGIHDLDVVPILRDYSHLSRQPDEPMLRNRILDGRINLLFVGRVVPQKCQHELLVLVSLLKNLQSRPVRLTLIGGISPQYLAKITDLAETLGLTIARNMNESNAFDADVLIPGQLDDKLLAAFYRHSDLFICLSDHEGFCVPLVEAMFFEIPIVAHNKAAVGETLGSGGMLLDKSKPELFLDALIKTLSNTSTLQTLRSKAAHRAQDFSQHTLEARFKNVLDLLLTKAAKAQRNGRLCKSNIFDR